MSRSRIGRLHHQAVMYLAIQGQRKDARGPDLPPQQYPWHTILDTPDLRSSVKTASSFDRVRLSPCLHFGSAMRRATLWQGARNEMNPS
eukprot:3795451-Rhodomonas_salina.1